MATTITPATLKVTITTQIKLAGQTINSENILSIPSINEFDKRILTVPTGSETTIVSFGATPGAGTFVRGNMKFFQVTNKDTVNYARIRIKKTASDSFDVKLDAGQSFMMANAKLDASETAAAFVVFVDADSIVAQAYDNAIDLEYVVAST